MTAIKILEYNEQSQNYTFIALKKNDLSWQINNLMSYGNEKSIYMYIYTHTNVIQ